MDGLLFSMVDLLVDLAKEVEKWSVPKSAKSLTKGAHEIDVVKCLLCHDDEVKSVFGSSVTPKDPVQGLDLKKGVGYIMLVLLFCYCL